MARNAKGFNAFGVLNDGLRRHITFSNSMLDLVGERRGVSSEFAVGGVQAKSARVKVLCAIGTGPSKVLVYDAGWCLATVATEHRYSSFRIF